MRETLVLWGSLQMGMNPRLAPTLELADYLTSRRVTDSKYFINNMMMTKSHMWSPSYSPYRADISLLDTQMMIARSWRGGLDKKYKDLLHGDWSLLDVSWKETTWVCCRNRWPAGCLLSWCHPPQNADGERETCCFSRHWRWRSQGIPW